MVYYLLFPKKKAKMAMAMTPKIPIIIDSILKKVYCCNNRYKSPEYV